MTPMTHTFFHTPREGRVGGGVGIFISNAFTHIKLENTVVVSSFEYIVVSFRFGIEKFVCLVVYRPPDQNVNIFMNEFGSILERLNTVSENVIISGDFNFWIDDINNPHTVAFLELIESFQFKNNITKETSSTGHILDLVLCDCVHDLVLNDETINEAYMV